MGFLIDSGVWIEVERGRLAVADVHAVTRSQPVFISPVTIAEMQLGAELIEDRTVRLKCLAFLRRLKRKPLLRIDAQTGEVFGSLAAQLHRTGRGHRFRVQDLWLASQAVRRRFKLLTLNGKDFADIPGLDLVVMRLPGN